ncbi:urease accessory protein UreD [Niveibacterium sp. 24ML]|uniref:urease accessory protein UreD n=1 Tax=Niveibacterium sp. 24ML TaxID=2985512 RepID=UPI00226F1AC9|nr:urease accessory protein UreD [Niveibacterium sp. 24ML]MCX9157478.1 urease accessory protein UreD [Niveibacterium sp. 24ML]
MPAAGLCGAGHAANPQAWQARLALEFERREARTVLSRREHFGPLRVQKALYPEGDALSHAILLHPPAGIAGGDTLDIDVTVGPGAQALLTTPGAGKWYRADGRRARQDIRLKLATGGSLEWLPQESMVFDHADGLATLDVQLSGDARFVGFDLWCLGRRARGERFEHGRMQTQVRISRDARPVFVERAVLQGGEARLASPTALGGATVFGSLLIAAPVIDATLLDICRTENPAEGRGAVTRLPGLLVARYRGDDAEAARHWFARLWALSRPTLLGRPACPPRIWNT